MKTSPPAAAENFNGAPFIPAALDDAGLTPAQFRIFCRICRRGDCTESVPRMATACGLERKTVWAAIRTLTARGMIRRVKRFGATSLLVATSPNAWAKPVPNGSPSRLAIRAGKRDATRPVCLPDNPSRLPAHKGSPFEGSPSKVAQSAGASAKPTWEQVKAEAQRSGKPEIVAQDWFWEMEGCGWIDAEHRPVKNWRRMLATLEPREWMRPKLNAKAAPAAAATPAATAPEPEPDPTPTPTPTPAPEPEPDTAPTGKAYDLKAEAAKLKAEIEGSQPTGAERFGQLVRESQGKPTHEPPTLEAAKAFAAGLRKGAEPIGAEWFAEHGEDARWQSQDWRKHAAKFVLERHERARHEP
ncbi:MAG: hypothetical protein ACK45B_05235 [Limisphaerales bacterium]